MPELPPPPPAAGPDRQQWMWGGVILLAFVVVQAAYAIALNRLFYAQHGPFYDSVSYLGVLAKLLDVAKVDGFFSALKESTQGATVFLPFGLVPFFGKFVGPDRAIGICFTSLAVLLCAGSLTSYLVRYRRASLPLALALSILFVSIQAVYFWNGGLSDFRMDLPFALLFSATITWLLIALREPSRGAWVAFGAVSGLTCLSRATTPVFLLLTCLPMVASELFAGKPRLVIIARGVLLAASICILLSGWFYVLNWHYLYYYFVWNSDANAHLPLSVSVNHLRFATNSVGQIVFVTAGLCSLLALASRSVAAWRQKIAPGPAFFQWAGEVEWRTLAPAFVPVGYLVLTGAGLNDFVSMPSSFGIVLFIFSLAGCWPGWNPTARVITGVALVGAGLSAITAIQLHIMGPGGTNSVSAYAEVSRAIDEQAGSFPRPELTVSHFSLGSYHNVALAGYLTFDRRLPGSYDRLQLRDKSLRLLGSSVFALATKVEWDALPGANDEQRIEHIVDTILHEADLVVMPTEATAAQLPARSPANYINRYTARIRQRLLEKGKWGQVSNFFSSDTWEEYCVMRNNLR